MQMCCTTYRYLLYLSLLLALITRAQPSDSYVKDQIVVSLQKILTNCNRLLNGTNVVGCQSNHHGNVGVLTHVQQSADVQEAINQLPLGFTDLIALVDVAHLDRKLLDLLQTNELVQGIVLLDKGQKPAYFSEDAVCPNQLFSFYKSEPTCHEWNSNGAIFPEGLRFRSIQKPIRYVRNRTEIDLLVNKCADTFNKKVQADGFRCVGRLTYFMPAVGSAPLCIRRQEVGSGLGFGGFDSLLCDPLQDKNVFAMLPPLSEKNSSTVKPDQFVLAVRMDTFSSIDFSRGGHISVLSSVIPLLSVAKAIGDRIEQFLAQTKRSGRQLLLAFFHGESMGYIGSSSWVWDMGRRRFPLPESKMPNDNVQQLGLDALSFYLELQQIGTDDQLYLHTDKDIYNGNKTLINQIFTAASSVPRSNVKFVDPTHIPYGAMPPSSYHTLLKTKHNIPGMVLSSFGQDHYNYSYLNSIFDTDDKFTDEFVRKMALAAQVALTSALTYVFNTSDPKAIGDFRIDQKYVKVLADCFQKPLWDCELFMAISNATKNPERKFALQKYANVLFIGSEATYNWNSPIRTIVSRLLVNSLGQKGPAMNVVSEEQCSDQNKMQNVYSFQWQNDPETMNGTCYRTSLYNGTALSPAFQIEDYDFSSGTYSTWMESRVDSSVSEGFELYLKADYRLELTAFLMAILVLIISAPLNFGLKEQWFVDNSLPPASPQPL